MGDIMNRSIALSLALLCTLSLIAIAGVPNDKSAYVGGTEGDIPANTEGYCTTGNEREFIFAFKNGQLVIPYDQINDLEYGLDAARRLTFSTAANPFRLFTKKKQHFLTIGWKDEHAQQHAAVFELGKSVVRPTIVTLEARTGKKVDYQDDAARKSLGGL
jgi:hypothetical protein